MSRATFATVIGVINAIVCFLVMFVSAFGLLASLGAVNEKEDAVTATSEETTKESSETDAEDAMDAYVYLTLISGALLLVYFFLFITSVLMVVGVRKQRHQLMAPWIYLSAMALIIEVFQVVKYYKSDDNEFVWYAFGAVVEAAIWYPIYKHYYALKHPRVVEAVATAAAVSPLAVYVPTVQSCGPSAEFNHATAKYVPTTVMVAAPQQQGQFVYPSVPAASSYFSYKV